MEVQAFNSEQFERGVWRYIIFGIIFTTIFVLSILNKNIPGAILLFFLLGGYFYYTVSTSQLITIGAEPEGLLIGDKTYNRSNIKGYVLEIEAKTQKIKNIVFVTSKGHSIHTLKDTKDNIKKFVITLNDFLPMMENYDQSFLEKMGRKFQL